MRTRTDDDSAGPWSSFDPTAQPRADGPRAALVHDWLNQLGGAENVLEELVDLFPQAPIYTSIYARDRMPAGYRRWPIHTSFMQRLPGIATHHQRYLPFYPLAFRRMDVSGYDLVVSNKSAFCHGVHCGKGAHRPVHVCYCLTPTRFLWQYDQYREREQIHRGLDLALRPLLAVLRRWDWAAAQRVDHFVAISREVQARIRTVYGRESTIIHPPVDTDYFVPGRDPWSGGGYYLLVSRLIPYKRIDLAVEAFSQLPDRRLVIVGEGRDRAALQAKAGPNISFLGRQPRARIRELLQGCQAFIFPGFEDFGIAPVEAMSVGRPVIAYARGGALDTVLPGVTGELFGDQSVAALSAVVAQFDAGRYLPTACRRQAQRFSRRNFHQQMRAFVEQALRAAGR